MQREEESTVTQQMADMLKMLLEDRQEERRRREEERKEREKERQRQDEQWETYRSLMAGTQQRGQVLESAESAPGSDRRETRTSGDNIKLAKLSEEDDVEAFLTTFERLMEAYTVDQSQWAFKLAPQLTGKAQQAYAALPVDEAKDYSLVKAAILHRYDINAETYRQRFRTATKSRDESYRELVVRLQDLLQKWTKECTTMDELRERIVMEQFFNATSADVRLWVKERNPKTAKEAGELADQFMQARRQARDWTKPTEGNPSDKRTGSAGQPRCFTCGKVGHLSWQCRKKSAADAETQNQGSSKHIPKCYNCNQRGHIASRCPHNALYCKEKSGTRRGGILEGWRVQRSGQVEGKPVRDILLDTGCSRTIVRKELVPESKMCGRETTTIKCAHGDTVTYPLAEIELEIGDVSIVVEAAVSETLPMSVLLGTDVPVLANLLKGRRERAFAVVTRAQARCLQREELLQQRRQAASGVTPSPVIGPISPNGFGVHTDSEKARTAKRRQELPDGQELPGEQELPREQEQPGGQELLGGQELPGEKLQETWAPSRQELTDSEEPGNETDPSFDILGSTFDDDLFSQSRERVPLTRRQKRERRLAFWRESTVSGNAIPSETCQTMDMTCEQFRQLQKDDPTLKQAWETVDKPSLKGTFVIRDGLLYRMWEPPGQGTDAAIEQLVLPQQCRGTVLKLGHSIPLAGHMGRSKTARRLLQRFYWPTLFRDVKTYCQKCEDCQKCYNKRPPRVPLVPLPIMEEPFQRMAMDIVGPLPKSRKGNRYILVLSDYATRYPEAVPLKTIDAEVIAEELVRIFAQVGIPQEILTDQGQNFMSQLLQEVYRLLHIQPIRTSPYHPQTDGVVERFNQTLKSMLRKYATKAGRDWDRLIPYLLFAYREVPQSSTGFSPFELLYGHPVRGPLDILRESWEANGRSTESVVSYVLHIREKLEKMMDLVQVNMKKAQHQQKQWYDRSSCTREFEVGEEVLVLLPTATNKLFARWQGPYPVVKRVGKVNYQVDMFDRRKRHRTFHVNMLRKWHSPTDTAYTAEKTTEEETDEVPAWRYDKGDPNAYHVGEQLESQQRSELDSLLEDFTDVLQNTPGKTDLAEHTIHLKEYTHPIRQSPYRLPHAYREDVQRELADMLQADIIEPSDSEWASPVVLVPKKDGSTRFCIDYRRLNAVSTQSAYPTPRVEDLVDQLGKAKFLTTLDLTRGYWQVPLSEDSRPRSAFTTPFGLFQFKVMPFGLHGAPATFQRMMDQLLKGAEHFAAAYLDDVIIYSQSWPEHLQHIREVLKRLRAAGLTARPSKCHYGTSQCIYLGHVVGGGEV